MHTSRLVTGTKSTSLDPSEILIAFHASIEPPERGKEREEGERRERGKITRYDFKAHTYKKKEEERRKVRNKTTRVHKVGENQSMT